MTPDECPCCGEALAGGAVLAECHNERCGLAGRSFERSRLTNRTQRRRLQRDGRRTKHRRAMQALSGEQRYSVVTSRSTENVPCRTR